MEAASETDRELRTALRHQFGFPLRSPARSADQPRLRIDGLQLSPCRLRALLHAAAAGVGQPRHAREICEHHQRARGRAEFGHPIRIRPLFRCRHQLKDFARAASRRGRLLQIRQEPARFRAVRPGADSLAVQLRQRSGLRHRVLDDLQLQIAFRLRESGHQSRRGKTHHVRPVRVWPARVGLHFQSLGPSRSRPDLHRVCGSFIQVARHVVPGRRALRKWIAARLREHRAPAGLFSGQPGPRAEL